MVSSSLEAGPVGALAVHADAHLERGPQSPSPGSADIGSAGCRRRCRRGAHGAHLQLVAAVVWSVTIFFYSTTSSSRCYSRSLPTLRASPTCSTSTRCSSTTCSTVGGTLYKKKAFSRVQQRCSKPPQTLSTSSPSILHTRPSFHARHFHHPHPYARLQ